MEASLDAFFLFFYRQALISIFFVLVFTANKLLFNFFLKSSYKKKRPEIFGTFFAIKKYY